MSNISLHLLGRCLAGDSRAWAVLEDRTTPVVCRAISVVLNRHGRGTDLDAIQDIVQSVYLRLIQHDYRLLRQFDPKRGSWTTWISLVARSTALNHLKRLPPAGSQIDDVPEIAVCPDPEIELRATEILDSLDDLLTPAENRVAKLLWQEDLSPAEIAQKTQTSVKTVYAHKLNIIRKIRDMLGQ